MTTPLQEILVKRIRAQGPMPFAAYMQLALYHPHHGYYASARARTGWGGDFVTAPEVDPAFGALWAAGFERIWEACGRPPEFHVIEIGPGEGGFAVAVLDTVGGSFADSLRYRLIERSAEAAARQRELLARFPRVGWQRSITEVERVGAGCFFANEVLDNLPVHIVVMNKGELREVCVDEDDGRLHESFLSLSNPELAAFVERCAVDVPEGHRFEVHLAADSLIKRARSIVPQGATIFVDYGRHAADLAARADGSVVCYSTSGADDQPLEDPGSKDVTVHANWTAVRAAIESSGDIAVGPLRQRSVLQALGLRAVHDDLRAEFERASAAGEGAVALRALSRRQALGAIADPDGLGGFEVVAALRGIEPPSFLVPERERAGP